MTKHRGPGPGPGGPWGGPWGGTGGWSGGFGPGGPGGGPRGRGRRRARRGDVRAALLVLLAEEPRNGYQLIQELAERSGGMWQPSPGAVYPALSQLEDEGLVRSEETDGRRSFRLTDEGSRYVEEHRERLGTPWKAMAGEGGEGLIELRDLVGQLAAAVLQVAHAGTDAQVGEAKRLLTEARRGVYRILAEDAQDDAQDSPHDAEDAPDDAEDAPPAPDPDGPAAS
jgi:DNA-binding PadR family transcriptional regulator